MLPHCDKLQLSNLVDSTTPLTLVTMSVNTRTIDPWQNGFVHLDTPLTVLGCLQIVLMFPLILLRIVIIFASLSLLSLIGGIASFRHDPDKPMAATSWRRKLLWRTRFLVRVILFALG